jgi:predicted DNA-binding transcriptional regulator
MSRPKKAWRIRGKIKVQGLPSGMVQVTHPGFDPGRWVGYHLDRTNATNLILELAQAILEAEKLEKEYKERREKWAQEEKENTV